MKNADRPFKINNLWLFLCVIMLNGSAVMAQSTPVDQIFDKLGSSDGYTTVFISKYMFDMFGKVESGSAEDKDIREVTSKLDGIRILTTGEDHTPATDARFSEALAGIPRNLYKELMNIKEKDQLVTFLVREEKGKINELLMIVEGKYNNALISIRGDIDLNTISKLSGTMQIQGMENLDKVKH